MRRLTGFSPSIFPSYFNVWLIPNESRTLKSHRSQFKTFVHDNVEDDLVFSLCLSTSSMDQTMSSSPFSLCLETTNKIVELGNERSYLQGNHSRLISQSCFPRNANPCHISSPIFSIASLILLLFSLSFIPPFSFLLPPSSFILQDRVESNMWDLDKTHPVQRNS